LNEECVPCVGRDFIGGFSAQQTPDRQAFERIIAKYARSVDAADTALAAEIWSQSPDVSFIHPQGYERGFGQIKQNIYIRAMGDLFSERKLNIKGISIHVHPDSRMGGVQLGLCGQAEDGRIRHHH
jgi:hypothetical protein